MWATPRHPFQRERQEIGGGGGARACLRCGAHTRTHSQTQRAPHHTPRTRARAKRRRQRETVCGKGSLASAGGAHDQSHTAPHNHATTTTTVSGVMTHKSRQRRVLSPLPLYSRLTPFFCDVLFLCACASRGKQRKCPAFAHHTRLQHPLPLPLAAPRFVRPRFDVLLSPGGLLVKMTPAERRADDDDDDAARPGAACIYGQTACSL